MNKPRMPKELIPLLEPGILYSKCPWRFHPDPPLLEKLFVDAPVVELPGTSIMLLGENPLYIGLIKAYSPPAHRALAVRA